MRASKACYDLIKRWEGFSAEPYVCEGGKLTVGHGHVIRPGELFHRVTKEEAEKILIQDVRKAETAVNRLVSVKLHQEHFDSLVSLCFNIGVTNFKNSTLLRELNAGRYKEAGRQFDRWVYARKRKLPGLVARRNDEEALFLSLPWQKPHKPKE